MQLLGWSEILGEYYIKSTCSYGCIDGSDDIKNDGSLLGSVDGLIDTSNNGNTDGSLIGTALSTDDECVLGKIKGVTVGYSDR